MTSGTSAKQRYKLSLGTVVEVMQSEIAITSAQTRLSEAQYDYKIAKVMFAYSARGRSELEMEATAR
jgi:outer membrane protein